MFDILAYRKGIYGIGITARLLRLDRDDSTGDDFEVVLVSPDGTEYSFEGKLRRGSGPCEWVITYYLILWEGEVFSTRLTERFGRKETKVHYHRHRVQHRALLLIEDE